MDDLFTIECGLCGHEAPVNDWCNTVFGPLPRGDYQCPGCGYAFKRMRQPKAKPWEKLIKCIPIPSQLAVKRH